MTAPASESTSTVIVGAGLFGLATAVHLAQAGRRVTVVESGTAAGATTAAGAGFVGLWAAGYAWYWNESELALEQAGLDFYRGLDAAGYDIGLRDTGNIWLALTEQAVLDHLLPFAEHPLRPEDSRLLTAVETAELVPGLDPEAIVGAFIHPDGIQISAPDAGLALAAVARAEDVEIIEQTPVTEILAEGGRAIGVLTAAGERILADEVVLAAGSWTNELLAATGRELPFARVIASRLTTAPFGLGEIPTLMIPELDGLWVREHLGGLTYGNGVGYEALSARGGQADRRPERPDLVEAMREHLAPIITGLIPAAAPVVEAAEAVQGIVSYTADRRFLAGAVPELAGLYVVAGDNESGVTHGPGLGRMLADLIVTGQTDIADASLYAPERFLQRPFADEAAVAAAMPARRAVDARRHADTAEETNR
ncbi:MAG TPA: FAD-binding oxidoreductase [Plantibacter sp.]|uniref:NAD(P)/FAD-dependent oxidoreductase n=1 Tax=unclassified Plantibacter TaxID=2624265 RepID=UPI002C3665D4|nr:FAD-binding oxidoreductase [Plantibacter sp.]